MTVYFDKERQRWRYDFEDGGVRHSGTCADPITGKRATSKNMALLIERSIRKALPAAKRTRITTSTKGWIYFVITADRSHLKIGWTKTLKSRLRELQTGNHLDLKLLGKRRGTIDDERSIHALLRAHRARGEWFKATTEVLAIVEHELAQERSIARLASLGILTPDGAAFPLRVPPEFPPKQNGVEAAPTSSP